MACLPQMLSRLVSLIRLRAIRNHLGLIGKSLVSNVYKRGLFHIVEHLIFIVSYV